MILSAIHRPEASVLVVSPMLWLGAAIPGAGLLLIPPLLLMPRTEGALAWPFLAMYAFFVGIAAYAFGRAALGQQVRVQRRGSRVYVHFWFARGPAREQDIEADLHQLTLEVRRRTRGISPSITLYEVTLNAAGWSEAAILHSGLTPWFARRAQARLSGQLGLQASAHTSR